MRTLKLHHPTGHPYWQQDEYQIELPNGKRINPAHHIEDTYGGYRVYWNNEGVWVQICASGSGYGKKDRTGHPPKLLVERSEYDNIEFVGNAKPISETLSQDLAENISIVD
jgi:hypothetical protein